MNASRNTAILAAINDSVSSRAAIDFLTGLPLRPDEINVTLIHILRKPSAGEELMGEKFMKEQPERRLAVLNSARDKLVQNGFSPDSVEAKLITEGYDTVADGIIDQFTKGHFNIVVIGRKKMSKAEEFVLGDPSVKLVRALEGTAVIVVKS